MTIAYPDVSNRQGAMALEAGTVAVCAKASEGTGFTDAQYAHFKSEAERVAAVFFAYHFLHAGNGAAQAQHCFSVVGRGVNVMIDCEPYPQIGSYPTVADALAFAAEFRALGGLCTLGYLPRWYWANPVVDGGLGSPSLAPLGSAGLSLISSDYTAYSDTGPGWTAYGGMSPVIWQWTDALPYSGQGVDFNAYRGTVDQLRALLGYTAPTPPPPREAPVTHLISVTPDPTGQAGNNGAGIFLVDGGRVSHCATEAYAALLEAKYGAPLVASPADYQAHLAAMESATLTLDAATAQAFGAAIAAGIKLPTTITVSGTETGTLN
jgi:hypothetical protein